MGATHASSFDLSFLRIIPNIVIMAPADEDESYAMLEAGYNYKGLVVVRYPRSKTNGKYIGKKRFEKIKIG